MGYNAVSTREIAQAASVNHAAIGFHFKGKQGLYEAVIEYTVAELRGVVEPFISTINKNIEDCGGDKVLLRQLVFFAVEQFLNVSMRTERSRWINVLLQREYVDPSEAFECIYNEVANPVFGAIERLVKSASGEESKTNRSQITVYCIMSLLTNMGRDRAMLLKRFDSDIYEPDMFTTLIYVVAQGICGILGF